MTDTVTGARVLVVDDDEGSAALLKRLLVKEGYLVDTAFDGTSALATIATTSPDVMLLDVVMPDANGFDLCRRIAVRGPTVTSGRRLRAADLRHRHLEYRQRPPKPRPSEMTPPSRAKIDTSSPR